MAEIKTQGTELYLLHSDTGSVIKIPNVSAVDGVGGSASDIDVTNFDDLRSRRFLVGLQDQGTASFQVNYDPTDPTHALLAQLAGGAQYKWALGLSDSPGLAPTYDAGPPEDFILPSGRTWFVFNASVQQWQRNLTVDDVIRISATLRLSGDILEFAA